MFRVSTEKQAEQGASLAAQQRRFRELAEAQHWTIVAEFRGTESATQAAQDRKVLQQVLACIREEQPDALYVHEQSRLTRGDELDVAQLMRELRERRIKIIVGGVVRDLSSIDERFMVGIQSLVDRAEAERIRERIVRGKREKGKQGRKNCGRAPYGYRNPPPGDPQRGILQIVPEQAATVRRIFELAADGVGLRTIAQKLNQEGTPTRLGIGGWHRGSIRVILNNVVYLGTHASNVWLTNEDGMRRRVLNNPNAIVVPDAHPPIVLRDLWDRAHGAIPHTTQRPSLLGGLLWVNGVPTICESSKQTRVYMFRGLQKAPRLRVDETEPIIWQALRQVLTQPAVLDACLKDLTAERRHADTALRMKDTEGQLTKLRQRAKRLLELRLDGDIDKDAFRRGSDEVRAAIQTAEVAIAQMRSDTESFDPDRVRRAIAAARVALAPAEKLDEKGRRQFIRNIVRRIDATAVREAGRYRKGARGKFQPGRRVCWRLTEITLTLGSPAPRRGCEVGTSSR